ncbi:LysM peptidoglycan-binding domain-containing protein, partial [Bacillus pumilus]|nr:LysM peptidoglycan-binding domain-containing protein [Bacillus pumilus]
MGKSVYQLWISQGKDKLRFPVLPSELEITNNVQNETVKVAS